MGVFVSVCLSVCLSDQITDKMRYKIVGFRTVTRDDASRYTLHDSPVAAPDATQFDTIPRRASHTPADTKARGVCGDDDTPLHAINLGTRPGRRC